ncbi:MAG: hypothetical protein QOI48_3781 [Solirubrobacteraceae bacterium]|jgi:hypothetical protein|nr:hypothetical protein [Solirubrobacteraceae bacterium]
MNEIALTEVYTNARPGLAGVDTSHTLGHLADLDGTWVGTGFSLIALPLFHHEGTPTFRLKLNTTVEILEFTPIGAAVPNRGFTQKDIHIHGLRYLQLIADGVTHEPLHIEPGLWLNVPASKASHEKAEIARQSTIPHGNSVLATGISGKHPGSPKIEPMPSMPISHARHPIGNKDYLKAYLDARDDKNETVRPAAYKPAYVEDPSQALRDSLEAQEARGQTVVETVALTVSTSTGGGISNIPSDVDAISLDAVFWIERVQGRVLLNDDEVSLDFLQLQYVQNVMLDFDSILWPHISVATLTKQ